MQTIIQTIESSSLLSEDEKLYRKDILPTMTETQKDRLVQILTAHEKKLKNLNEEVLLNFEDQKPKN